MLNIDMLKGKLKELGYQLIENESEKMIIVATLDGEILCDMKNDTLIGTEYWQWLMWPEEEKEKIMSLLYEFRGTSSRNRKRKYYIKYRCKDKNDDRGYFVKEAGPVNYGQKRRWFYSNNEHNSKQISQLTDKEVREFKERYVHGSDLDIIIEKIPTEKIIFEKELLFENTNSSYPLF